MHPASMLCSRPNASQPVERNIPPMPSYQISTDHWHVPQLASCSSNSAGSRPSRKSENLRGSLFQTNGAAVMWSMNSKLSIWRHACSYDDEDGGVGDGDGDGGRARR